MTPKATTSLWWMGKSYGWLQHTLTLFYVSLYSDRIIWPITLYCPTVLSMWMLQLLGFGSWNARVWPGATIVCPRYPKNSFQSFRKTIRSQCIIRQRQASESNQSCDTWEFWPLPFCYFPFWLLAVARTINPLRPKRVLLLPIQGRWIRDLLKICA
jgi:hypothetical protein